MSKGKKALIDSKTLVEKITHAIETDDGYKGKSDDKIISEVYSKCSEVEKDKIDGIFIRLTGYSLDTLLNRPEEIL